MLSGEKLVNHKKESIDGGLVEFLNPKEVIIPLVNHSNMNCNLKVKKGDKVKIGSILGMREDHFTLPIVSSASGVVKEIKKITYLNNEEVEAVVITNDFKDTLLLDEEVKDIDLCKYSKEDFVKLIRDCAVTGMGGSDFPTYVKYMADTKIDTLIVNAVECEPFITADYALINKYAKEVVEAINVVMTIFKIKTCFIGIKEGNKVGLEFDKWLKRYPNINLSFVKNFYPMGWERHLIQKVTGKTYKSLPSEEGIIVNNASTMYEIYEAIKYKRALASRIVTISGLVNKPCNVEVRLGTLVSELMTSLEEYPENKNLKLILGGPMMGNSVATDNIPITKNMNSILVMENNHEVEESTCLRCGKCSNVCPSKLCPVLIKENINNEEKLKHLRPKDCISCGLCTYICPSKIDLRSIVNDAKKRVK